MCGVFAIVVKHHPLNLIQTHRIARAIIELGRARAGMRGHHLGFLKRPAVGEMDRDACRPEGMAADLSRDPGRSCPPLDHLGGSFALQAARDVQKTSIALITSIEGETPAFPPSCPEALCTTVSAVAATPAQR
jgi:hypothetical protein